MTVSDPVGLLWCLPEIGRSLGRVESLLASPAAAGAATAGLDEATVLLRQVRGALRLLGLPAEAIVLAEIDALLADLSGGAVTRDATVVGAVQRAFADLIAHLDEVAHSGHPASPIALLGPLQALRGARRAAPATLFDLVELDMRGCDRVPEPPPRGADDPPVAAVRTAFEKGLLQAMRDPASPVGPRLMARAVSAVRASPAGSADPAFWWVADAWLGALRGALVPLDAPAHKLLTRLNRQLRAALEGGHADGEPLMREMLQAIVGAPAGDPLVDTVREAFGLPCGPAEETRVARTLSVDPAVLTLARDALGATRSALDRFTQGSTEEWPAFRDGLAALAGALSRTGAPGMDALGRTLAQVCSAWVEPKAMTPAAALELATALLFVEQALARGSSLDRACEARAADMAAILAAALEGRTDPQSPAWLTELGRAGQVRATETAVAAEAQAALRTAESVLDGFLREGKAGVPLTDVERALRQVGGALAFLGQQAPARVAASLADTVSSVDAQGIEAALGPMVSDGIDQLAESLAALGFLVDALGLPDDCRPPVAIDPATGCLRIDLRHRPVRSAPIAAPASARPLVPAARAEPQPVAVVTQARAAVPASLPVAEPPTAPASADMNGPETLAALLEPSGELLALVDDARRGPMPIAPTPAPRRPGTPDAVPSAVDRAPATPSPSAPQAQPYPELGIAFEIDLDSLSAPAAKSAQPEARDPASSAQGGVQVSARQVSDKAPGTGAADGFELDLSLLERASEFATSDWEAEGPLQRAASASRQASAPAPVSPEIDDELLMIFLEEADTVLETIASGVLALRETPASRDSLVEVRRGFHTLKGSGRMVGLRDFGDAAWSFEQLLNTWLGDGRPADAPLLDLIERAHQALLAWVAALHERVTPSVDFAPLAAAAAAMGRGEAFGDDDADEDDLEAQFEQDETDAVFLPGADYEGRDTSVAGGDATATIAAGSGTPDADVGGTADAEVVRIGGRTIGRALHAVFREEAAGLVAQLSGDIRRWRADPARGARADAMRAAHTLAGNAAVIRLEPLQTLAEAIENAYTMQLATRCLPSDEDLAIVEAAVDRLHEMLETFVGGEWPTHQPRIGLELDFLIGRWSVPAEDDGDAADEAASEPAPVVAPGAEATFDPPVTNTGAGQTDEPDAIADFDAIAEDDASVVDATAVDAIAAAGATDDVDAMADVDAIADFDEIEALQPIDSLAAVDELPAEPMVDEGFIAIESLHDAGPADQGDAVSGADAGLDDEELDDTELEDEAAAMAEAYADLDAMLEADAGHHADGDAESDWDSDADSDQHARAVADAPGGLDVDACAITGLLESEPEPEPGQGVPRVGAFDTGIRMVQVAAFEGQDGARADAGGHAAHDDAARAQAGAATGHEARVDEHEPVDELDADLLPVFIEEASDDIPRIGETLRAWSSSPADARLPQTLMRLLHTVKGSARMAGAMRLGQMLHDVETRVERLTATGAPSAGQIDELVADTDLAVALFEAIRDPSRPLPAAARVTGSASEPTPPVASEVLAQADGHADALAAQAPARADALDLAPPADAVAQPAPEGSAGVALAGATPAADAVAAPQAGAAAPRPALPAIPALEPSAAQTLVRVRAELLDRLVSEAGEVSIGRSRLDNELSLLRQSLVELNENVGRLRSQLREIEIQADTQIQARIASGKEDDRSFDPLEFDRYTRFQELARMLAESVNDVATVQGNAMRSLDNAGNDLHRQGQVLRDLQQNLMRARMVQFGSISDRLYRVIRQSAKETGKRVNLDLRGATVEVDRSVLERMAGPIEHLLRNSVAHGIERPEQRLAAGKPEAGEIQVEVRQEGREIVLSFTDDGAGLDLARIRARAIAQGLIAEEAVLAERELAELIFVPGFSTATSVTELSGRGVGMDVVRMEVSTLGGRIDTETRAGAGTRFTVHLPLTLAVTQVVLLGAGRARLAVPSTSVEQLVHLQPGELAAAYAHRALSWQGKAVPLFFLGALMQQPDIAPIAQAASPVVIVRAGHQRVAVHADEVTRNKEVVVKSVGAQAARVRGVAGATVLGNGDIVLIANAVALAQSIAGESLERRPPPPSLAAVMPEALPPMVMVVDDSLTVRKVTQRLLAREGYRVMLARDGIDALGQLEDAVPDVMLLDIEMPRMDGFELLRHLRADARWASIPIVMITSRTADKHRNHALGLGVSAYLGKPYAEDELLSLVERLGRRAPRTIAAA